ncbi:MAG: alpha/beta hydrolase [Rhodobacteraceae bacterium]|nr:alpha/beta hydrolase [Paracoccaceae bacterium]
MPLLQINADGDVPRCEGGWGALSATLAALPEGAPVIVMIHGFRFSPTVPGQSPHTHILSLEPVQDCWKAISWPRHLGFGRDDSSQGLCIAFGWEARGTIWAAYAEAARAGAALAALMTRIDALRPGTRVEVLAHSLGARVTLQALAHLDRPILGRAVLMAAAEFRRPTEAALATPAGRAAEFVNVTSRENDLFDFLIERLVPLFPDRALGQGTGRGSANWIDIQLDQTETLDALVPLGHRIPAPDLRICHWSLYLRPGVFGLYRALLRDHLPLATLRERLPQRPSRRWSRLFAPPRLGSILPSGREA